MGKRLAARQAHAAMDRGALSAQSHAMQHQSAMLLRMVLEHPKQCSQHHISFGVPGLEASRYVRASALYQGNTCVSQQRHALA